jgi:nucleotide-binding universal stress UspA family protein
VPPTALPLLSTLRKTVLCEKSSPAVQIIATVVENAGVTPGTIETVKSQNADLIVVDTHGSSGIARLMLG